MLAKVSKNGLCIENNGVYLDSTLLHNCGCEVEKAHAQPQPNLIIGPSKHLQSAEEATQDHSTLQAAGQAVHAVQSVHQPFDFSTLRKQQLLSANSKCKHQVPEPKLAKQAKLFMRCKLPVKTLTFLLSANSKCKQHVPVPNLTM